jgi:hypothetical protein
MSGLLAVGLDVSVLGVDNCPGMVQQRYAIPTTRKKNPQHRAGAYWQISYTRPMKSRKEYVRREWLKDLRRQIATRKRFKRLVDQWTDLNIEHSRLTMRIAEPEATR